MWLQKIKLNSKTDDWSTCTTQDRWMMKHDAQEGELFLGRLYSQQFMLDKAKGAKSHMLQEDWNTQVDLQAYTYRPHIYKTFYAGDEYVYQFRWTVILTTTQLKLLLWITRTVLKLYRNSFKCTTNGRDWKEGKCHCLLDITAVKLLRGSVIDIQQRLLLIVDSDIVFFDEIVVEGRKFRVWKCRWGLRIQYLKWITLS